MDSAEYRRIANTYLNSVYRAVFAYYHNKENAEDTVAQSIKEKAHHDDHEDSINADFCNWVWEKMCSPEIESE